MIGDAMDEAAIQKCMQGKPLSNAAPMQFFCDCISTKDYRIYHSGGWLLSIGSPLRK